MNNMILNALRKHYLKTSKTTAKLINTEIIILIMEKISDCCMLKKTASFTRMLPKSAHQLVREIQHP